MPHSKPVSNTQVDPNARSARLSQRPDAARVEAILNDLNRLAADRRSFQPLKSSQDILAGIEGEHREFLASVLRQTRKAKTWIHIELEQAGLAHARGAGHQPQHSVPGQVFQACQSFGHPAVLPQGGHGGVFRKRLTFELEVFQVHQSLLSESRD
jgi:hypothetical protein